MNELIICTLTKLVHFKKRYNPPVLPKGKNTMSNIIVVTDQTGEYVNIFRSC